MTFQCSYPRMVYLLRACIFFFLYTTTMVTTFQNRNHFSPASFFLIMVFIYIRQLKNSDQCSMVFLHEDSLWIVSVNNIYYNQKIKSLHLNNVICIIKITLSYFIIFYLPIKLIPKPHKNRATIPTN